MGKGFFKKVLATGAQTPGKKPRCYKDWSVCAILGIRRRVLAEAKRPAGLGVDWGFTGAEAGMSFIWIKKEAAARGIALDKGRLGMLVAIKETTTLYTVRKIGPTANGGISIVLFLKSGERGLARTPEWEKVQIMNGDVFDVVNVNGVWEWTPENLKAR